jgi:tRNA pseudouridine13 synthase
MVLCCITCSFCGFSLDVDADDKSDVVKTSTSRIEPILLTDENVADYSITDVVLPLPGYDIRYPENDSGTWYKELLAADGMENFDFRNKIK